MVRETAGGPMALALQLAAMGDFGTSPNPMVGAVVVKDGEVVGHGYHQAAGEAHAEVIALDQAGELARGASLWVTLEPCNHQGRTGPCTTRILAEGIEEVHVATLDPNPRVQGRGVALLRQAGLRVVLGEHEAEAERLIEHFAFWVTSGKPWVTLKFAMSLDGKAATRSGKSQWITGESARARAHLMRHQHDAVMVGSGTLLADDPALTARWGQESGRQPVRVVVDSRLRTPLSSRLLREGSAPVLLAAAAAAPAARRASLEAAGAEVLLLAGGPEGLELKELLGRLAGRGITSVLVEGGPRLLGSLVSQRLMNRLEVFISPMLIGGAGAPGPIGGDGVAELADALRLGSWRTESVGPDLLITAEV